MDAFLTAVAQVAGGCQAGFEPVDVVAEMETQVEHVDAGIGVVGARAGGALVGGGIGRSPGLPGLDVGPFPIEESQAAQDVLAATFVEFFGRADDGFVVSSVAEMGLAALGFGPAGGRE